MKTIKVSQEVYDYLSEMGNKKDTYNDIILKLIQEHNQNEEFDDNQATYYNKCIEKIENEDYSDIVEVDFDNIDEELKRLENEGIIYYSKEIIPRNNRKEIKKKTKIEYITLNTFMKYLENNYKLVNKEEIKLFTEKKPKYD